MSESYGNEKPKTITIDGVEIRTDTKEYVVLKGIIFHISHKLNAVLGLNEQEQKWLETMGGKFE